MKSGLKLDRNIPIPETRGCKRAPWLDVLLNGKVGDSILVNLRSSSVHNSAKRIGMDIATRKENGALRVWKKSEPRNLNQS